MILRFPLYVMGTEQEQPASALASCRIIHIAGYAGPIVFDDPALTPHIPAVLQRDFGIDIRGEPMVVYACEDAESWRQFREGAQAKGIDGAWLVEAGVGRWCPWDEISPPQAASQN